MLTHDSFVPSQGLWGPCGDNLHSWHQPSHECLYMTVTGTCCLSVCWMASEVSVLHVTQVMVCHPSHAVTKSVGLQPAGWQAILGESLRAAPDKHTTLSVHHLAVHLYSRSCA